jgi:uncharacterized protein
MKELFLTMLSVLILACGFTTAQDKKEDNTPKFELKQYYFVMLIKGPNRAHPDSIANKIQEGHMANINKMAENGKLVCAGPFADEKGGGILVLDVQSEKEARELIEKDPAVSAGRLIYEIRPWMTGKGTFKNEK